MPFFMVIAVVIIIVLFYLVNSPPAVMTVVVIERAVRAVYVRWHCPTKHSRCQAEQTQRKLSSHFCKFKLFFKVACVGGGWAGGFLCIY